MTPRNSRSKRSLHYPLTRCTSDSLLSGAVTSIGGCAVQYSHWNGFDLTTITGTDKLKKDLLEKTQQSQSISRFHRIQTNTLIVLLWLVKKYWCEAILEQMWGSASLDRGGVFSELKNSFTVTEHLDVSGVASLMVCFLQNPGSSSVTSTLVRFAMFPTMSS